MTVPFLLHVGGREHYKNFAWMLDAFGRTELSRRFGLVVVGSQPDALPAERLALARLPSPSRVAFLGRVTDTQLAALYRLCAAVVTASRAEGFGLPLVEAAAVGAPVVHPRAEIFRETLGAGPGTYRAGSAAAFAGAVDRALRTPAAERDARAAEIRTRFAWDRTAALTAAVYESVAAELSDVSRTAVRTARSAARGRERTAPSESR